MIVSTDWLQERLQEKNLIIFDCRFNLAEPAEGARLYEKNHIPTAVYAHLEHHLSGEKGTAGGRHPLPDLQAFQAFLESRGVSNDSIVVAYDDGLSMFAGRLWWLLTYVGHKNVFILDGGYNEWTKNGCAVSAERPIRQSTTYRLHVQKEMIAGLEDVKAASSKNKALLIDARAPERYLGETEPLDRVPGHIPGAINRFFAEGMKEGKWKNAEEQKKRFKGIDSNEPVIVYCGSGVSATSNVIALKLAGYTDVKLYPGSYSEWSSDPALPIETKGRDINGK